MRKIVRYLKGVVARTVLNRRNVGFPAHCASDRELKCAFHNGEWLRVAGELVEDDRIEARESMLEAYPSLKSMYAADDGNTEVFYLKNATATFCSFTKALEVVKF